MTRTKKSKVLKKGTFVEKKKKHDHTKKVLISVFVAVLMVSSILAITLSGTNSETERFNGFKFTRADTNYWLVNIEGTQYQFQMLPQNLIYYFLNSNNLTTEDKDYSDKEVLELNKKLPEKELTDKINEKNTILLSTDVDSLVDLVGKTDEEITQTDYYLISSLENSKFVISNLLNKQGKTSYVGSYYNKDLKQNLESSQILSGFISMNEISCDNSDENTLVILFKPLTNEQKTKIEINKNCAIISFSSINNLNYLNEYLLYSILGVFMEE